MKKTLLPPYLKQLSKLGFADLSADPIVYPHTRDRKDTPVFRNSSGVTYLRCSSRDYSVGDAKSYYNLPSRISALRNCESDDSRRAVQFRELARNSNWLDVGAGLGGFVAIAASMCNEIVGVEPMEGLRKSSTDSGLDIRESIKSVKEKHYDVVSLFHVFEHLEDPLGVLSDCKKCLKINGRIIIEVPHARDFLLSNLDCDSFKEHTYWSEHLILHTRESLKSFINAAGFKVDSIMGYQRYPLSNHLHWLAKGTRGGHKNWSHLNSAQLDSAYASKLAELDSNDTIIAIASVSNV